jgi:UDP-sulfoquinovose synthase
VTFEKCPEWETGEAGYQLKDMKVMVLGMDGYLGWPLALWLARRGYRVSGVDNFHRRGWAKEKGSHTIVPITRMTRRLQAARREFGVNIEFREIDVLDSAKLREFMDEVKPEAVVHYAECPSAPYSMVDVDHAAFVQTNNVIGTLKVLFHMRDLCPAASLLKLGTMGEYGTPLTGRPIFEGVFPDDAVLRWNDREWSLGGEMIPRDPGSFYHVSKVQDTFNVFKACRFWGLRSHDVMQGVIYGVHTDEAAAHPDLRTRLDMDEWFGTVINRFAAQAVVGFPLTVYGSGGQTRGFIALRDAMQCMQRLLNAPPEGGEYEVVNQMTGVYSILSLAETVARVASEKHGLRVRIRHLVNPRVEADEHPFDAVHERLPERFGFEPKITLEKEVADMLELLLTPEVRTRIEEKKHVIQPRTHWSGRKKDMVEIEFKKGRPMPAANAR